MIEVFSGEFWAALVEIIAINVILSGDNALVIALACRGLPPRERKLGVLFGTLAAIVLRILFAIAIVYVLKIPALMLIGSLALMWIAIKLVQPEEGDGHGDGVKASTTIWQAVKIVCVADAVMSLDNVIAVAAAAKGDLLLLSLGIAISIPPVVLGSTVMLYILDRFPILVIAGSGLLGYIAGELAIEDKFVHQWFEDHHITIPAMLPYVTCALVVAIGLYLRKRAAIRQAKV
ncbi:MAG: TerC family protein [Hyphomicrobiales bacterium]